jgi:hypothetical protein
MEKLITFATSKKGLIIIGVVVIAIISSVLKGGCCTKDSSCESPAACSE